MAYKIELPNNRQEEKAWKRRAARTRAPRSGRPDRVVHGVRGLRRVVPVSGLV